MLRLGSTLGLLIAVSLPKGVQAKPLSKLEALPDIEEVLQRAGWTMTPEMSAAYSQPGDIFDGNNSLLKKGIDCFEVQVQEGAYASMEVNRSLEAGVRMKVLVAGGRAGMGIEKKLVFDTPTHRQIPRLDLVPTDPCLKSIQRAQARGENISGWYVITDSLSAVVQKQECGSYDAKVGAFVVSGNTKIQQMCEQTSLEPVAVAYKSQPLVSVLPQETTEKPPLSPVPVNKLTTEPGRSVSFQCAEILSTLFEIKPTTEQFSKYFFPGCADLSAGRTRWQKSEDPQCARYELSTRKVTRVLSSSDIAEELDCFDTIFKTPGLYVGVPKTGLIELDELGSGLAKIVGLVKLARMVGLLWEYDESASVSLAGVLLPLFRQYQNTAEMAALRTPVLISKYSGTSLKKKGELQMAYIEHMLKEAVRDFEPSIMDMEAILARASAK